MTLDGLRGVAAINVAILHMQKVFGGYSASNAHLAVDFFLQLSGFVIAHAYASRIRSGMRFRDFLWRRVERLYPAYLLGLVLGLIVAVAALRFGGSGLSIRWTPLGLVCSAVPNTLMLPEAFCGVGGQLFPANPPMWSVFYELIINLLLFAAIPFLAWRRSFIVSAVFLVATVALTHHQTLDAGFDWNTFLAGFCRLAFSFLVGVGVHGLHLKPRGTSTLISLILAALLAGVLNLQFHSYLYEIAMVVVAFPAILVVGGLYNPTVGRITWVFAQLGLVSYVLYAIHKPLYQLAYAVIKRTAPEVVPSLGPVLGSIMLAGFVVVAWLVARFYELPARRFLARLRGDTSAPRPPR